MLLIAEAGINHNGHLDWAFQLIDQAVKAGWQVVKFQKRDPDTCVPEHQKNQIKIFEEEQMTYLEYKKRIEFGLDEYKQINEYCKKKNILWTVSVWDVTSAKFIMDNFKEDIPFIKIPSACNQNKELAEYFNTEHPDMPIFLSIGMTDINEFKEIIQNRLWHNLYAVLHCNSSYPSKENELDLNFLDVLYHISDDWELNFQVGYSGHEENIFPTIIAYVLNANIIERHITIDKKLEGTDQKASLELNQMIQLKQKLEQVDIIKGKYDLICYPSEEIIKKKLRG